jgi:arylsulfatase A-like enzyme
MLSLVTLLACQAPDLDPPSTAPARPDIRAAPTPPEPLAAPEPADPSTFTMQGQGGPNILWITLDTVSAGHLAAYGGRVPLRSIEGLGAVQVKTAISNFPETALSHWSMLTGVLPEVHGNVPGVGQSRYSGPTFQELARVRGYATGAFIGGLTLRDQQTGLSRGFDHYDDDLAPGQSLRPGPDTVAAARRWLHEQRQPWFAFVHLFDAHLPYSPSEPGRFDPSYLGSVDGTEASLAQWRDSLGAPPPRELEHAIALYDSEIVDADAALAPLFSELGPNDIVIVTADHGESFAHGYYFNHRAVLYEDTLHVPLFIRAPGLAPAAVEGLFALIDLAPTVAELAGWEVQAPWMGQSRVGLLRGQGGGAPEVWSRTDPWLPLISGEPGTRLSRRTATDKLIIEADGSACRFDLVEDPRELNGRCSLDAVAESEAYLALIKEMAKFQRELPERMGPNPQGEMLRQLGYVDHHTERAKN